MIHIYNSNGDIIRRSKNLAGVRHHASHNLIERVELQSTPDGGGILHVLFTNGDNCAPYFSDFNVMQAFVRRWRNAHGATLVVNGGVRGEVTSKEPINYPVVESTTQAERNRQRQLN